MRRYLIYAAVYGTIGICVGLAMAYVSKDGQPYFSIVGGPSRKRDNMIELDPEKVNLSVEEVPEEMEVNE